MATEGFAVGVCVTVPATTIFSASDKYPFKLSCAVAAIDMFRAVPPPLTVKTPALMEMYVAVNTPPLVKVALEIFISMDVTVTLPGMEIPVGDDSANRLPTCKFPEIDRLPNTVRAPVTTKLPLTVKLKPDPITASVRHCTEPEIVREPVLRC
jgi:hypothetical protein